MVGGPAGLRHCWLEKLGSGKEKKTEQTLWRVEKRLERAAGHCFIAEANGSETS